MLVDKVTGYFILLFLHFSSFWAGITQLHLTTLLLWGLLPCPNQHNTDTSSFLSVLESSRREGPSPTRGWHLMSIRYTDTRSTFLKHQTSSCTVVYNPTSQPPPCAFCRALIWHTNFRSSAHPAFAHTMQASRAKWGQK